MTDDCVKKDIQISALVEALHFYADPETYHACSFMFDRPTGGFDEDFSIDHGCADYDREMPGQLARNTLNTCAMLMGNDPQYPIKPSISKPLSLIKKMYKVGHRLDIENSHCEICNTPAINLAKDIRYGTCRPCTHLNVSRNYIDVPVQDILNGLDRASVHSSEAQKMLAEDKSVRQSDNPECCKDLFDHVIWVDASKRMSDEDISSCVITIAENARIVRIMGKPTHPFPPLQLFNIETIEYVPCSTIIYNNTEHPMYIGTNGNVTVENGFSIMPGKLIAFDDLRNDIYCTF